MAYSTAASSRWVGRLDQEVLILMFHDIDFLLDITFKICSYFERFIFHRSFSKKYLISIYYVTPAL